MLSINLFVLREKNRYCMTKGLVNPDVVEREEKLFTSMEVNERKHAPASLSLCLCLAAWLSETFHLRIVPSAHLHLLHYALTDTWNEELGIWKDWLAQGRGVVPRRQSLWERREDAKCLLRGHLQLFCSFLKVKKKSIRKKKTKEKKKPINKDNWSDSCFVVIYIYVLYFHEICILNHFL